MFHNNQRRRASYFVLLWIVIGLFFGTKRIIETHVYGYSYPWDRALGWQLWEWSLWGLLSLIIFAVCRFCERRSLGWGKREVLQEIFVVASENVRSEYQMSDLSTSFSL